jgi:hypothetical protein
MGLRVRKYLQRRAQTPDGGGWPVVPLPRSPGLHESDDILSGRWKLGTMVISQQPEEIRKAFELQTKCELKRVVLRSCQASVESTEAIDRSAMAFRLAHLSSANAIADGVLRIQVKFSVHGESSAEPPAHLFLLECAFDLDYELHDAAFEPSPESVAAFKDGNAVFNCWPYTREFVHNITTRMGLDLPPLPFLRIVPKQAAVETETVKEERKPHSVKRQVQRVRKTTQPAAE